MCARCKVNNDDQSEHFKLTSLQTIKVQDVITNAHLSVNFKTKELAIADLIVAWRYACYSNCNLRLIKC